MHENVIDLWGDIGSEGYWDDLPVYRGNLPVPKESVYVPFDERWPQPGFIGRGYLDANVRVLVVGQNPRATNRPESVRGDEEMFDLIRSHARNRSADSLSDLFSMMGRFMQGHGYGSPWGVVQDIEGHLDLELDCIAYLNVIPLATHGDTIRLATCKQAYQKSTKLQLTLLEPHKILFHGKTPYEYFHKWEGVNPQRDTAFLPRRYGNVIYDPDRFAQVKEWLRD